jgi:hypothetical protein
MDVWLKMWVFIGSLVILAGITIWLIERDEPTT